MVMSTKSMSKPLAPTIEVAEHEAIVKSLREAHAVEISNLNMRIEKLRELVSFVAKGGKPSEWLMTNFPKDLMTK